MNHFKRKTFKFFNSKANSGQAGFSLLAVVVASGIAIVIIMGITSFLTTSFASQNLITHREEKIQLQRIISQTMSCEMAANALKSKSCVTDLNKASQFIYLQNKSGQLLGRETDYGYRKLGAWGFKGACMLDSNNKKYLAVATIRVSDKNQPYRIPMSKEVYKWHELYDINSPAHTSLCQESLNEPGTQDTEKAEHLENKVLEPANSVNGCGSGILGAILGNGKTKIFRATIACEPGKIAVSGGVECMAQAGSVNGGIGALGSFLSGSPKGLVTATRPALDGKGWYVECCLDTGGLLGIGRSFPSPKGYAVCVKP